MLTKHYTDVKPKDQSSNHVHHPSNRCESKNVLLQLNPSIPQGSGSRSAPALASLDYIAAVQIPRRRRLIAIRVTTVAVQPVVNADLGRGVGVTKSPGVVACVEIVAAQSVMV